MSEDKVNVPKIRFPGFTDAWEQRRLGEVSERVRGNDGRMDLPTLTISAGSGWLDQRERFSENIAGAEQKNYTLLHKGELSYNHGNSKLAKYGAVFELQTYEEALVPRVYHSFKTTDEAVPDFIEYMFATKKPDLELEKLVSSGVRMNGLLNINYDDFMGIKITLPSVEEQKKISSFLRRFDNLITLHQRKLTNVKDLKAGLLQKVFPKDGEDFPEVRFPGFTDAWEQRKLGELVEEYIDRTEIENEDILLSCSIEGMFLNSELFSHQRGASNIGYLKVKKGDLILSAQNLHLGNANVNLRFDHGIISPAYKVYSIIGCLPEFLAVWIKKDETKKFFFDATTVGASLCRRNVEWKTLYNQRLAIPQISEQKKIAEYFFQLDGLINLHQRTLEHLQQQKKSLLQQMFV